MLDGDRAIPPAAAHRRREWRRACRALRALLRNPDDTIQAFAIFDAVDRGVEERAFQRFRRDAVGRRLLAERPSLPAALADRAALAALPAGSFGRAYLAYLDANRFDPHGLLHLKRELEEQLRRRGEPRAVLDPAREWFRNRGILTHDLWHVLTDYGTDDLGEAALLPFALAQSGGLANTFLVLGVAVRGTLLAGLGFPRYLFEAWRRGRRTPWLAALPYEDLLTEPLADVRRLAGIPTPADAHRDGIRRGSWARPVRVATHGAAAT